MSKKYVLVKSYYGLGGDLCVLIGAMRLAQQTGREVLVDWNGGFYGRVPDGRLINEFFDSPTFETSEVLSPETPTVFPPQWHGRVMLPALSYVKGVDLTLSRPEEVPADCTAECVVITRDSKLLHRRPEDFFATAQRLRPASAIQSAVSALRNEMGESRPSIGIHYRHGNGERKVIPPDPRWFRNRINARLRALDLGAGDISLFVATDCGAALDYFRRYYPNTYASPKEYRPNGSGAMHVGREDLTDSQKMQLALEALTDMYTLAGCSYFVGSKGFFSLFVKLVRGRMHTLLYEGARLFNNYEFSDVYVPVDADPVLRASLRSTRQTTDGLFARVEGEERQLLYYDEILYKIPTSQTALTSEQLQELRHAIASRRTY